MKIIARQKGMTLIEVVVSMLIIGLGLVMCMSMLQTSLRYQTTSIEQNDAMQLMQEMMSKMRMNSKFAGRYTFGQYDFEYDTWSEPTNLSDNCDSSDNYEEVACNQIQKDVSTWLKSVGEVLPGGKAEIDRPDAAIDQYRIQIQWINNADLNRVENSSYAGSANPSPLKLSIYFSL